MDIETLIIAGMVVFCFLVGIIAALLAESQKPKDDEARFVFPYRLPFLTDIFAPQTRRAFLLILADAVVIIFFMLKENLHIKTIGLYYVFQSAGIMLLGYFLCLPHVKASASGRAFVEKYSLKDADSPMVIMLFVAVMMPLSVALKDYNLLFSEFKAIFLPLIGAYLWGAIRFSDAKNRPVGYVTSLVQPALTIIPVVLTYILALLSADNKVMILAFMLIKTYIDLAVYKNVDLKYEAFIKSLQTS